MKYYSFPTPIGILTAYEENGALVSLTKDISPAVRTEQPPSVLLAETKNQLTEYFKGTLKEFSIPLCPHGTAFQQKVWEELRRIPYGETRSYEEIAIAMGNPKAMRAVGSANNRNPIIIITPCHRVIGKHGDLTGYALGLDIKKYLLELELHNGSFIRDP